MRAVRREGQMVKGEERRVKRLNVKVLVKLAAIALVVLAALALGRDATLAHGSGWGRLTTELTFGNEQVRDPATTLFAFEPIDGCGDDCCCRSGVECGLSSGCSGHGPAPWRRRRARDDGAHRAAAFEQSYDHRVHAVDGRRVPEPRTSRRRES